MHPDQIEDSQDFEAAEVCIIDVCLSDEVNITFHHLKDNDSENDNI